MTISKDLCYIPIVNTISRNESMEQSIYIKEGVYKESSCRKPKAGLAKPIQYCLPINNDLIARPMD